MKRILIILSCISTLVATHEDFIPSLHQTVLNNDIITLKYLLPLLPEQLNSYNQEGFTPLHLACALNRVEAGKILLEGGAKPNMPHKRTGLYPLHMATSFKDCALIIFLIEHHANLGASDPNGDIPLKYAIKNSNSTGSQILFNNMVEKCKKQRNFYFASHKYPLQ